MIEVKNAVKTFDDFTALDGATITVPGHGADGGELLPRLQGAGDDHPPQTVLDLPVDGPGVAVVQLGE